MFVKIYRDGGVVLTNDDGAELSGCLMLVEIRAKVLEWRIFQGDAKASQSREELERCLAKIVKDLFG